MSARTLPYLGLALVLGMAACAAPPAQQVASNAANSVANRSQAASDPTPVTAPPRGPSSLKLTRPLSDFEDEISGASAGTQRLSGQSVPSGWQFGAYLLDSNIKAGERYVLSYSTASGGPVYAHLWYYSSVRQQWEAVGWQYNPSNVSSFSGTLTVPANAIGLYLGFFSERGGSVNTTLESSSADTGNSGSMPAETVAKFQAAIQRAGSQLGSVQGGIVAATAANTLKQQFSNGLVLYRQGASQAYAIYGPVYQKYMAKGGTGDVGFPSSEMTKTDEGNGVKQNFTAGRGGEGMILLRNGRSEAFWVHGSVFGRYIELGGAWGLGYPTNDETPGYQNSVYQLFDGSGLPSLQYTNGKTYKLTSRTRDLWASNFDKLGMPVNDEENGKQRFEKGEIVDGRIVLNQEAAAPDFSKSAYHSPTNIFDQFGSNWYECTRYAYGRGLERTGKAPTFSISSERHGGKWFDIINNLSKGQEPRANAFVSWKYGTQGHVAYVEKVEGDLVTFSEANWASPTDGKYKGFKTLTKEQMKQRGSYTLAGYVYLN